MIQPCGGCFFCAVGSSPVGENESFEFPVVLQHVGEQIFVLAGIVSVHAVVRTHDRAYVGIQHSDLES